MTRRALLLTVDYAPQTGGQPLLVSSIVDATADLVDWRVVTAAPSDEHDEHVVRTSGLLGILRATWAQRHWLAEADDRLIVSGHVYLGWVAHLVGLGMLYAEAREHLGTVRAVLGKRAQQLLGEPIEIGGKRRRSSRRWSAPRMCCLRCHRIARAGLTQCSTAMAATSAATTDFMR